jgi:hypothetical protein
VGIRDELAAHDARFISVDELLEAVAEAEGVSVAQAARYMSLNGVMVVATHRLRGWHNGEYYDGRGDAAAYSIDSAIHPEKNAYRTSATEAELQQGEPGFFRSEIAVVLADRGIAVPACLGAADKAPAAKQASKTHDLPVWMRAYAARVWIPLSHAADIISGVEPGDIPFNEPDGYAHWIDALKDAANSGQIDAGGWSTDQREQPLSHASIRAWCANNGIVWPVPPPPASPTLAKLFQAAEENGRSVIELETLRRKLEAVTEERDKLKADIEETKEERDAYHAAYARQCEEVERLRAENAALRAPGQSATAAPLAQINGETFKKLVDLVAKFPTQYPDLARAKLDADVRPWMEKEAGLSTREKHVFGVIIAQHFGLKD